MEEFKNMLHQVGQLYQNLTKKQRIVIAASLVVVVALLVFLALYYKGNGSNSSYATLVDNINPSDAAAIVAKLEQNGVSYTLENERTIKVPQSELYKQRMMIASEGLVKDNRMGFEIFDTQIFGATKEDDRVRNLRALQGELSRSIESLEPIQRANVLLAIPKDSVFVQNQQLPTASVTITIKEGLRLNTKQIQGIKNIVAAAIPRLTKENVKIIDSKGTTLDEQESYDNEELRLQIEFKKNHENELEQKILNTLTPIVGAGKVVANVNIDFNFDKMQSQSEVYDPNTVVRSEQTLNEESQGRKDPATQGVPGAVSNIGPIEGLSGESASEWHKKNQVTTNNEISKTVTNRTKAFGIPERITATVMIDGKYQERLDENGDRVVDYIPLPADEIQKIQAAIEGTIGFNSARGDSVSVNNIQFKTMDIKVESQVKSFYNRFIEPFIPPAKYIIAAILLFIFYKKVIAPFTQKMLADVEAAEIEEKKEAGVIDDAEDALEKFNAARKRVEEQLGFGESINEDALQYDVLLEKLKALVSDKSQEVATLLQTLVENDTDYNEHKDL